MKRTRTWLTAALTAMMAGANVCAAEAWRPEPRWRGFNLLGMFQNHGQKAQFEEEDFKLISELGFNFVRIPMDYRFWIQDKNWEQIDEGQLAPVDQVVAYGKKYKIHVQLCFHRAPGYTVAQPPEARDLFKDDEALRVCCKHWAFFARRYKGCPSRELSFNLFNEPDEVTEEAYEKVAAALVRAIRAEDPSRFIVADGIAWGGRPAQSLFKLGIGQAMRGYRPMSVSHYLASWAGTPSDDPLWPPPSTVSPLYGPVKAPLNVPLVIKGLPAGTLMFRPGMVSGKVRFRVEADGLSVCEKELEAGLGAGWTNGVYKSEWKITQAKCLTEVTAELPQGAQRLTVSIAAGDWAELSNLTFTGKDGRIAAMGFEQGWGKTNGAVRFCGFDARPVFQAAEGVIDGRAYLKKTVIEPWQPAFDAGVFAMVGEFGAYNRTPHPVVLEWMEDNLKLWKERNLGWALWNFKGPFGVLDSGRTDVAYEAFHGHQLDRKMLDLLLKY
ncbi:MAG: cellulase family glycosylhydrolase [bacterium]